MRSMFMTLVISMVAACLVFAQGAGPQGDPKAPQLDDVMAGWEKAMTSLQSLSLECERVTKDKVFKNVDKYKGTAKFLKSALPNQSSRASLELYKEVNGKLSPDRFEKYICSGTFLYEFDPANKTIRVHTLPPPKAGQMADDNLLTFLFGMKAAEAKDRYQITYVPSPQDKWYHYLKIRPKQDRDKEEFQEAYVALLQTTSLPAQVRFIHVNGNEVTWTFRNVQANVQLKATEFEAPALPKGWQVQRVDSQKPKIRGSN